MTKSESKYFHTARRMDEALISLLNEKDFAYITVKDICAAAEVNRSTFYLHYENIGDLLRETLEEMDREFQSCFSETAQEVLAEIPTAEPQELVFVREKYLVPYLEYRRDHRKVYRAAYQHPEVMQSRQRYEQLYFYIIDPVMERFHVPQEKKAYYNAFFMHGTLAVIEEWVKNDCKESPEEISRIIETLVPRGK